MKKFREYVVYYDGWCIVYGSYGRKGSKENLLNALNAIKLSLGKNAYEDALLYGHYHTYLNKDGLK